MTHTGGEDGEVIIGHVKWFDTSKGFGFVTAPDVTGDILLHANVLRNFGQSSVAEGARVRIRVIETHRGKQAHSVLEIEPPDPSEHPLGAPLSEPQVVDPGGPLVPARVKWFDRSKGFGFANEFGSSDDVFIHVDVLRRSTLADLQPGEAVAIRVAIGERGRLATHVSLWESAINSTD
ncbi:cold-shock protein [Palleronia pelagia]|uniref:Cold-shock DNA-binding protein family n=1 Tax=Palleronia pelagia TaxID=387096 RepID=A0A1H8I373_9RHOB|nr:cold shock domain-containing protein [Palleronia pelagia]SEN62308.1 cold-shock DNA-binding protein family [Palleronia pelagia]